MAIESAGMMCWLGTLMLDSVEYLENNANSHKTNSVIFWIFLSPSVLRIREYRVVVLHEEVSPGLLVSTTTTSSSSSYASPAAAAQSASGGAKEAAQLGGVVLGADLEEMRELCHEENNWLQYYENEKINNYVKQIQI